MAEGFRKLDKLPPLRLTVAQIAQFGDDLAKQMESGGKINTEYSVSFEDGTGFVRESSSGLISNLDAEGDRIDGLELSINAWSSATGNEHPNILKTAKIQFRPFGSQFYVSSTDPNWGKGAMHSIKARLGRHRPWFAPLLKAAPALLGLFFPLPIVFILLAGNYEKGITGPFIVVTVLSALLLLAGAWLSLQCFRSRFLANTVVFRTEPRRNWLWLKVAVGAAAFVADIGTLVFLIAAS
jgi:hypothetical protein